MIQDYQLVTLTDGRRGYFYHSAFVGNYLFQPVDDEDLDDGMPELVMDDDYEVV